MPSSGRSGDNLDYVNKYAEPAGPRSAALAALSRENQRPASGSLRRRNAPMGWLIRNRPLTRIGPSGGAMAGAFWGTKPRSAPFARSAPPARPARSSLPIASMGKAKGDPRQEQHYGVERDQFQIEQVSGSGGEIVAKDDIGQCRRWRPRRIWPGRSALSGSRPGSAGPAERGCRLKEGRPCARPIRVPAPARLDAYVDDARKQWRIYLGAMHRPDVLSGGLKFKIAVAVQVAAAGTAFSVEMRSSGR